MGSIWLEVDGSEMMTTDFAVFLEFLSINDMQYASYYGEDEKIVMEVRGVMTEDFDTKLSQFTAYQPIIQLDEEPIISDIDLIDELTNID
jgi:hypothetical protein